MNPSMTRRRWTEEEDRFLLSTVLETLREGGSQTLGVERAAKELDRPAGAVTFRWYNHLKRKHIEEVQEAVEEGKKAENRPKDRRGRPKKPVMPTFEEVRRFIDQMEEEVLSLQKQNASLTRKVRELEEMNRLLRLENERLRQERDDFKSRYEAIDPKKRAMEEDYRLLVSIIARAREMELLEDEERMRREIRQQTNGLSP